jgi:hypothetical protein
MFGIKTRFVRFVRTQVALRHNCRILRDVYGQRRSLWNDECLDAAGNLVPWFTYPAIEYLNQLDLSDLRVLEFGSGCSTLYWARRAREIVSIEDNRSWYERTKPRLPGNVDYIHAPTRDEIVRAAAALTGPFDIVVNDGVYRYDCALASRPKLADGGMIILDNSDWCTRTSAYYRDSDLIEVDMAGFTPLCAYPMTTSFFFSRNVRLKSAHDRQPVLAVGGEPVTDEDLQDFVRG